MEPAVAPGAHRLASRPAPAHGQALVEENGLARWHGGIEALGIREGQAWKREERRFAAVAVEPMTKAAAQKSCVCFAQCSRLDPQLGLGENLD